MNTRAVITLCLAAIAVVVFLRWNKGDESTPLNPGPEKPWGQVADREPVSAPATRSASVNAFGNEDEQRKREELTRVEIEKQTMFSTQNAMTVLGQAEKHLMEDLNLSAREAAEVEKIFFHRQTELAGLLAKMYSGQASDDRATLGKICALLRNKGLRQDLAGVLSPEKLATFDANEANRLRESIEARAYLDMADISDVVPLTDAQKQLTLAALMKNAPEKVEQEADARAFMTLHYGQMLTDVDSSAIRGLSNMVSAALENEFPNVEIESPQYQQWTQANKTERIEGTLSALQNVLDEKQLARYREHLEAKPAW